MKKIIPIVIIILFVVSILKPLQSAQASAYKLKTLPARADKLDAPAKAKLSQLQSGDMLTVIVTLREQADLSRVNGADRAARQQGVIRALQATANATQGQVAKLLRSRQSQGSVKSYDSFWIFNGFSVTASSSVINELSQHPDVFSVSLDEIQIIPAALSAPGANISLVNAPALWDMGYSGQGVVVASMDTGVDASHPDLATRWRGGANSWFDPYNQHPATPIDLNGHGTWTTGIMVGGDSSGTTIGVAPGARWIAAKIFNDQGGSTATAIHLSFQWLLDPDHNSSTADAPDVVNNSWTYANPGCYLDFEPDLQSLRAAGILPVFAAGNGGPSSDSSYSPANNPSAFAVGATDNASQVASFSSRGPTTCGGSSGPFPEIVAPGIEIHTTGLYGTYYNDSGTSFAAPHVAGGLALLLSAFPNLSANEQASALINTGADLGAAGADDVYGFGQLNLLAAYQWQLTAPTATPTPWPTYTPTFTPTFTPTATATALPTSTPTKTPSPAKLHIGDLDALSTLSGTKWNAYTTILVHDSNENPLANATVAIKWMSGTTGTASCKTNASGICQISKTGLTAKTTSVTLSVTKVTHATLTYLSSSNHDPDGDSNGTTIVIAKP